MEMVEGVEAGRVVETAVVIVGAISFDISIDDVGKNPRNNYIGQMNGF